MVFEIFKQISSTRGFNHAYLSVHIAGGTWASMLEAEFCLGGLTATSSLDTLAIA